MRAVDDSHDAKFIGAQPQPDHSAAPAKHIEKTDAS
jgi:hypothetical protein